MPKAITTILMKYLCRFSNPLIFYAFLIFLAELILIFLYKEIESLVWEEKEGTKKVRREQGNVIPEGNMDKGLNSIARLVTPSRDHSNHKPNRNSRLYWLLLKSLETAVTNITTCTLWRLP